MKNILITFLLAATFSNCTQPSYDPALEEWQQLFNGQNLEGWDVKIRGYDLNDNFGNTFRVTDSLLTVSYDQYDTYGDRFGHLFYKDIFSYYRLRVEYRFTGEQAPDAPAWAFRNSGAMLHGQTAVSMLKDQDFPISIEGQFLGGNGTDERHTSNLCTPGTNVVMDGKLVTDHCIESTSKTYHGDQWVTAEFLVLGDSLIRHILEGETVMEYQKPQIGGGNVNPVDEKLMQEGKPLAEGTISLQSESHPIQFRKVELLQLCGCMDKKAKNYKSYYVKADNSKCLY